MPFSGLPHDRSVAATDEFVRQAEELAGAGATYLVVSPQAESRAQFLDQVEHLGRSLIPRLDGIEVTSPLAGL